MTQASQAKLLFESYRYLQAWASTRWAFPLGCAGGIAIAYHAAARFSLTFLGKDVYVFSSGIAVGILVTLGQRVQAALAIGVFIATVTANLMVDSLWPSVLKGVCNAGEPQSYLRQSNLC